VIWAGSPFAHRIEFSTGQPTGAVSYELHGNEGQVLLDLELNPEAGALSGLILIGGAHNSCGKPLFENRTLIWNYLTADGLVSDRITYRVQRPVPFAAAPDGVRLKLGVEAHELKDDEIDLVSAYAEFVSMFEAGALTVHETAGDRSTILCIHAIEAIAALQLLSALQLKVAKRETSGTNEWERFTNTDWVRIELDLASHIARARAAVDPSFDATGGTVFSFGTVTRADPLTGA
jgi:hypothetical protein